MFSGISWLQYIKSISLIVMCYYLIVGWIYQKDLLRWLRDRKK